MNSNERRRPRPPARPEFAIEHDPDDPFVVMAGGLLDDPRDLVASVLDDLRDLSPPAKVMFADQAAKRYSALPGSTAAHFASGWLALTTLLFLEAFCAREDRNISPGLRKAITSERATLRHRAGNHFIRAI